MTCAFCHQEIKDSAVMFNGASYHATLDENGNHVPRGQSCWDKSECGKRSL